MRRVLVVSMAVLCVAWAGAAPIDFHAPGQTLGTAVERLGQQLGRKLYVSANIRDEVVVVHVTAVEPDELLKRLADVANAQWRTTASGDVLERTPTMESELKRKSVERRAAELKELLDKSSELLTRPFAVEDAQSAKIEIENFGARSKANPSDPTAQLGLESSYAKGPAGRLMLRLLRSIDPKLLVDMEFGERRVFNLTPTTLQYGFGNGAKESFEAYVREQNVWAATVMGYRSELNYSSNPLNHTEPVTAAPLEWSVVVSKGERAAMVYANLVAWRADGGSETQFQFIPPDARVMALGAYMSAVPPTPKDMGGLLKELAEATVSVRSKQPKILSDEARKYVLDPVRGDVGGLIMEYVLRARHPSSDIVAVLPDETVYIVNLLLSALGTPELFDKYLTKGLGMSVKEADGWLLVEPADVYLATHERTPRSAMERYLYDTVKAGTTTLENYSKLAAATARPSYVSEFSSMLLGLPRSQMSGMQRTWNTLRLYGLLVPAQRIVLQQGGAIKYGELTQPQRQAFLRLAVSQSIDNRKQLSVASQGFSIAAMPLEPTELLAEGIPLDAELTMAVTDEPVVFGHQKVGDGFKLFSAFTPSLVGMYVNARKNPGASPSTIVFPDAWSMGVRRTIAFKLSFAADKWQLFPLTEEAPVLGSKPSEWEKLPPAIVEQIKKAIANGSTGGRRVAQ